MVRIIRFLRAFGPVSAIVAAASILLFAAGRVAYADPQGDAVTVGKLAGGVKTAVTGKGATLGRLADLEEEAQKRVRETLSTGAFIVRDADAGFIPAPLAALMTRAAENSPEIKVMRAEIAAMEQKVLMAGAPMMPEMEIMFMGYPVKWPWEMNSPMAMQRLTVSQPFYSYGKRGSKEKIAAYDVALMRLTVAQMEYKMSGDVIDVYFDLAEVAVDLEMLDRRDELLEIMEEIALLMYELSKAPLSEALAVQTMRSELSVMRVDMETMQAEMRAMLAGMLNIPESELDFPLFVSDSPVTAGDANREEMYALASSRHPETAWLKTWDEQLLEKARLAEKNYHPDYKLTFQYDFSWEMADRFGVGIMFGLPIYQRRMQDAEYKEAMAVREQVPLREEGVYNAIRSKSAAEFSKLDLTLQRIRKYDDEVIPLTQSLFDAAIAGYQVGKSGFAELVDAEIRLLDYEIARRLAIVAAARSRAKLYYYTLGAVESSVANIALASADENEIDVDGVEYE